MGEKASDYAAILFMEISLDIKNWKFQIWASSGHFNYGVQMSFRPKITGPKERFSEFLPWAQWRVPEIPYQS